jgi:hypothetical protein
MLSNGTFGRIMKRINKDISKIENFPHENISVEENIEKKEIYIKLNNNLGKEYFFIIDQNYPFNPPREFYCNKLIVKKNSY